MSTPTLFPRNAVIDALVTKILAEVNNNPTSPLALAILTYGLAWEEAANPHTSYSDASSLLWKEVANIGLVGITDDGESNGIPCWTDLAEIVFPLLGFKRKEATKESKPTDPNSKVVNLIKNKKNVDKQPPTEPTPPSA